MMWSGLGQLLMIMSNDRMTVNLTTLEVACLARCPLVTGSECKASGTSRFFDCLRKDLTINAWVVAGGAIAPHPALRPKTRSGRGQPRS